MDNRLKVTGTNYDIEAWQLDDGTWAVQGFYGDYEIDSLWMEVQLPTFADADTAVLEVIADA